MRLSRARGFTLLEMLAVIVLLGIVATIVVRQVGGNVDKGKYGAGKAQLATLSMQIENYALDMGAPPRDLNQLLERPAGPSHWAGPYAKPSELKDPFGHPFGYRYPGQHGAFDLIFYGQDGQPGGEGYSADLGNWEEAAGFTLLELLLVIALMAVALGVLSFGLGRGMEAARERQALRDIVGALRQARTQSVLSGLPQQVRFDLAGHRFQAPGQALGHWPADLGVQLTTAADLGAAVAFFPDGSSSGGHLLLARGSQAWRIDVGWLLGDVRLQALQ